MTLLNEATTSAARGRRLMLWVGAPFLGLLIMTIIVTLFDLDRSISGHFYQPESGWFLAKKPLWAWMYKRGTIPGIVLSVSCLVIWLLSYYLPRLRDWRKPCLVVVLTTIIGAGILVNAVLKQYWGRPRPSQTIEYGGQWEYRPTFPPGTPGKGASFPSGHSTMGFVFLAAAAFYPRSKPLAVTGVTAGVVLGGLMSMARVVQGAHFPSDTVWAGGIVWMTAAGLMILLPEPGEQSSAVEKSPAEIKKQRLLTGATVLAVLAMAGVFLTWRPYYSTRIYPLTVPSAAKTLNLQVEQEVERLSIQYTDQPEAELKVDVRGYGWLKFKYFQSMQSQLVDRQFNVDLTIEPRSYFSELDHALTLTLPADRQGQLELLLNRQPVAR